ncbi:hypothetical protein ACDP63_24575, partial [Paracoccus sp. P2]|uniref:hypothetical protein n=1 Tax=Paracoccus sp. P2 TaxID=3248840 RepID=UPI00391EFE13
MRIATLRIYRFDPHGLAGPQLDMLRGDLGRVDKRDSRGALIMIQAGICDGDQLGTRPDVGRG